MGLMSIVVKGVMETRKAKALARLNHEHAAEMAQLKTDAASVNGQSTVALHKSVEKLVKTTQEHHDLLVQILHSLTGGH